MRQRAEPRELYRKSAAKQNNGNGGIHRVVPDEMAGFFLTGRCAVHISTDGTKRRAQCCVVELVREFDVWRLLTAKSLDKEREVYVHASQSGNCTTNDDYHGHLLGLLGEYIQGSEELPLRIILLGLRHRNFSHFRCAGVH